MYSFSQVWEHAYGDEVNEVGNYVIENGRGTYVVAGWTDSYGSDRDIYILEADSCGELIQSHRIHGASADEAYRILAGGTIYTLFGESRSFSLNGGFDFYTAEVPTSFSTLSLGRSTGNTRPNRGRDMVPRAGGGYVSAGFTSQQPFLPLKSRDILVMAHNSLGVVLWVKEIGGDSMDIANAIIQTADGGYAVCGATSSYGNGMLDLYVVKLSSQGNIQWAKAYGTVNDDYGYDIKQVADGGYVMTGFTWDADPNGNSTRDVYLIRTDGNGNMLWSRAYGGSKGDEGRKLIVDADSGFAIIGYTRSYGAGDWDAYLIRTDDDGSVIWGNTYGGSDPDQGLSIQETSDNGYIFTGYTESFGAGQKDVYLVKTNSMGLSGCSDTGVVTWTPADSVRPGLDTIPITVVNLSGGTLEEITPMDSIICECDSSESWRALQGLNPIGRYSSVQVFPNPTAGDCMMLRSTDEQPLPEAVSLLDLHGRAIAEWRFSGESFASVNLSDVPAGIYVLSAVGPDRVWSIRFVRQ